MKNSGRLRIGDDWNAITIIALSQQNPLKAVAEFVENSYLPVVREGIGSKKLCRSARRAIARTAYRIKPLHRREP